MGIQLDHAPEFSRRVKQRFAIPIVVALNFRDREGLQCGAEL